MTDYQITARVRVNERHPKEWIVDALYDNLDRKHQEDIIEWYVTETFPNRFNRDDVIAAFEGRYGCKVVQVNPAPIC